MNKDILKLLEYIEKYLTHQQKQEEFIPSRHEVPVSGTSISIQNKLSLILAVLDGWYTEHKYAYKFQKDLAEYIGTRFCSLCNSGSSANLLALSSAKNVYKPKGRYVVTTATCFPTTVFSIVQARFIPMFIDLNPVDFKFDLNKLGDLLLDDDVAGCIFTHTLGFPFDAKEVRTLCNIHKKFFIEDNCDSLGAEINGKKTGSFGHISTLSMFPAHHITMIEGGAVFTSDNDISRMVEKLKNWGRDCWCLPGHTNMCGKRFDHQWESMPEGYDHKYTFTEIGYNLKTTDLQAALGISQFSKIHNIVASRLANYHNLKSNILNYDISTIEYDPKVCVPSPFGFPIHVNSQAEFSRNELIRYLETNKIRTRPIFSGNIVRQPVMKKIEFAVAEPLTGSDAIMNEMFWIGCHPEITHEHLNYVKDVFNKFFDEKR